MVVTHAMAFAFYSSEFPNQKLQTYAIFWLELHPTTNSLRKLVGFVADVNTWKQGESHILSISQASQLETMLAKSVCLKSLKSIEMENLTEIRSKRETETESKAAPGTHRSWINYP